MKFARIVYYAAGIYGIIALFPQYFMEAKIGQDSPPAITHPEFFYGFVGCALVFQLIFFIIARDVLKYRTLIPVTVLEKLVFAVPCIILYLQHRLALQMLAAGMMDLTLGVLFTIAYFKTAGNAKL